MTSRALGYELAFRPRSVLHRSSLRASSRQKPIARERRGSLLGRSSGNNPGQLPSYYSSAAGHLPLTVARRIMYSLPIGDIIDGWEEKHAFAAKF